jgi:hypothetical protein
VKIKALLTTIIIGFVVAFTCHFIAIADIDAPHNESTNISCGSCHGEGLLQSFWGGSCLYSTVDGLCQSCHTDPSCPLPHDTIGPQAETHTDSEENVLAECIACHDPHYQKQNNYKNTDWNNLYLASGVIESYHYDPPPPPPPGELEGFGISTLHYSSITYKTGTGWEAARLLGKTWECRGAILFPNVKKLGYSYPIIAIEEDTPTVGEGTITVQGDVTPVYQYIASSDFAVMYGQFIKDQINVCSITRDKSCNDDLDCPVGEECSLVGNVKFFDKTGRNSFAYDESMTGTDPTPNDECQVCHTNTTYWKANGEGADHYNNYEKGCIYCHWHTWGFVHGGGGSGGTGCIECHGHDEGYEYSPGLFSQGKGTFTSHSTHTENDSDDLKGPFINCDVCHDTTDYPKFYDGKDLSETNVCNPCHSSGGAFDGVNDAVVGAKNTWKYKEDEIWIQGVYQDNMLRVGKEMWCTGCHDDEAPTINGVTAKNVSGDNIVYGYFVSGHGTYDVFCTDCHDPRLVHFDSYARTYAAGGDASRNYTNGYRLNLVNGNSPMAIPRSAVYASSQFRLCYSCHDENSIINLNPILTSFVDFLFSSSEKNLHRVHLQTTTPYWDSDLSGELSLPKDSAVSCPACHNPHGKDYDGRATISMTRQDMAIIHKRDVTGLYGYQQNGDCDSPGGDLNCFGCHIYNSPFYTYYYQLGTPPPEDPGFWTKLDSQTDVTNPTYGTGGTFLEGTFTSYDRYGLAETGLSIVSANQGCEFPASNINSNDEYYGETIDFWYIPNFNFNGNTLYRFLFDYYDDVNNSIRIAVAPITGGYSGIGFQIINGGANNLLITNPLYWTAGSVHRIVCTWGPAQGMHIYVDGEEFSYYTSTGIDYYGGTNQTSSYFYVGRRYDGALHASGIIDDFKIYGYQYQKFESDISLFSKMGSVSEIQNPIKGNGGIIRGIVSYVTGQQGYGTQFSSFPIGAVGFPTTNLNPAEDTIDLWYNPSFNIEDNTDSKKHLFFYNIDDNNNAFIKVDADALNFTIIENGNSHTLKTTGLKNWDWYHVVCTWGQDGMHIYIDDKEASYSDNSGISYTGGLPTIGMPIYFVIGNTGEAAGNYCEGIIDELRVYGY